jgi:hypothetical protein
VCEEHERRSCRCSGHPHSVCHQGIYPFKFLGATALGPEVAGGRVRGQIQLSIECCKCQYCRSALVTICWQGAPTHSGRVMPRRGRDVRALHEKAVGTCEVHKLEDDSIDQVWSFELTPFFQMWSSREKVSKRPPARSSPAHSCVNQGKATRLFKPHAVQHSTLLKCVVS